MYYSMEAAQSFCKQRHGELVSINDDKERLFLWHQVIFAIRVLHYVRNTHCTYIPVFFIV